MKSLRYILLALLFSPCLSIGSISYASAEKDKMLSVEFNNLSLPDALSKLKDASGVDIVLKRTTDQNRRINKKYDNSSLDDIILDIFRDDNLTASFRYSAKRLTHIGIWMLPRIKGGENKPVLFYEDRERGNTADETKTDIVISNRNVNADTANYKNTKLDPNSADKNINKNKKRDLNKRVVNNTGAGAYYVNASEKDVTQNQSSSNNNYANNEAVIDAINKGTTEIPVPIEIPVAIDMSVTPEFQETLVFDAPPMPPGM